jgi:hypothetical protein
MRMACGQGLHDDLHALASCKSCRLASHRLGVARRRLGTATHHSFELTASLSASCESLVKLRSAASFINKRILFPSMSDSCMALAQMRACMCAPLCPWRLHVDMNDHLARRLNVRDLGLGCWAGLCWAGLGCCADGCWAGLLLCLRLLGWARLLCQRLCWRQPSAEELARHLVFWRVPKVGPPRGTKNPLF